MTRPRTWIGSLPFFVNRLEQQNYAAVARLSMGSVSADDLKRRLRDLGLTPRPRKPRVWHYGIVQETDDEVRVVVTVGGVPTDIGMLIWFYYRPNAIWGHNLLELDAATSLLERTGVRLQHTFGEDA